MKIFIHIGDARTGSSTLQAMMAHNRARLHDMGIEYPALGTRDGQGIAHHALSFSLLPVWPAHSPMAPISPEVIWNALLDHLDTVTSRTLILSSEAFLNLPDASIAFVKDMLSDHEVTPVCVRRKAEDWRRSWIAHRIRQGEVVPPPKTPARDLAGPKIDRWKAHFDVVTLPYSGTVLDDVLAAMGIDLHVLEPIVRRNESCSDEVLQLLNRLNEVDLNEANRARLQAIMARFPGLESLLDDMSLDRADRVQFNAMLVSRLSR